MQSAVAPHLTSAVDITLQHTPVIAGRLDLQQRLQFANPALASAVGYPSEQLLGSNLAHTALADIAALITRHRSSLLAGEAHTSHMEYQHASLGMRAAELTLAPHRSSDGSIIGYLFFLHDTPDACTDLARLRQLEQQARQLALYDPVTNLPNRRRLHQLLDQCRAESAVTGGYCALLSIELDNFKSLNDLYGRAQGDLLLGNTARRLIQSVQLSDTVARIGDDEFVVILRELGSERDQALRRIRQITGGILAALGQPYHAGAGENPSAHGLLSPASIGALLFRGSQLSNDELLQRSALALYRARANGGNQFTLFEPEQLVKAQRRLALEAELRGALERRELRLHYQPLVDAQQCVIGMEALLRWQHPQLGLLPPDRFIPLAEHNGLIVTIGQWVLDTACAQLAQWQREPRSRHWTLNVNISARQVHEPHFFELLQGCLTRSGIDRAGLCLELTESLLLKDLDPQLLQHLHQLQQSGVQLALDDFGTGYSSLNYLKQLPLDWLKIDKSFIRTVPDDPRDQGITQAILSLAAALDLKVVAEGVETREQFDYLRAAGCDAFQGYLFGRAMPAEQLSCEIFSRRPPSPAG